MGKPLHSLTVTHQRQIQKLLWKLWNKLTQIEWSKIKKLKNRNDMMIDSLSRVSMKTVPDIQIHTEEGVVLDYINPIITKERILECIELVQKALIPFIDENNEWLPDIKSIKVCFKLDSKGPPAYVISSDEFRSMKYSELYLNVSYFESIVNRRLKSNSHDTTPSKLTSV